jgi:hypothetical protein
MIMEQPPILQAGPAPEQKGMLGRIGLYFSLAPLVAMAALMLCKPG